MPADVADAAEPTLGHDWGFTAEPDGERGPVPLPRARLVGGHSMTNGTFFVRGWPAQDPGSLVFRSFLALSPVCGT